VRAEATATRMLLQSMPPRSEPLPVPSLSYDAIGDLARCRFFASYANIMVVPGDLAAIGRRFIAMRKPIKGKVTFASSGHGTSVHLSGRTVQAHGRIENAARALSGSRPAFTDLVPGRVDVMFNKIGAVLR